MKINSLSAFLDSRPEPMLVCNSDNEIVHFNGSFQGVYQSICQHPPIVGQNLFSALPPHIKTRWLHCAESAQGGNYSQEDFLHHYDDLVVKYTLTFSPLTSAKFLGWTVIFHNITPFHDELTKTTKALNLLEEQLIVETNHIEANVLLAKEISERKQAEENLLESKERLTQIIHGNSIPTFVIDQNHQITHWNKALEKLTGISGSEAVGTTNQWKAFYTRKRPTMADLILDQAPEQSIHQLYTDKYIPSSLLDDSYEVEDFFELAGNPRWLFFTAAPLRNRAGEIIGAVETLQDITARKAMEKEILTYQQILEKKVEDRTEQLKKTYEQLLHAEKLSAVGKLAASIAHEFGNPIIGIRNFLKGLKLTCNLDQTDSELLDLAIQECHRVKDLISNLQNFNRPTSGTVAPMDLHQAINDMLVFSKKNFKENNITVQKRFRRNLPRLNAVQDQIKQVILNCLNNAQESIGDGGGTIYLTTEKKGGNILLHIKDTGKGIKENDLVYIFEPFFSTKPAVEGTGLGLSVSYGIMKKHQGKIEVTDNSPKGTTFTLTLPVAGHGEIK
nr:PAS domain S-box protein [Desulfobulbaceae bacterium]